MQPWCLGLFTTEYIRSELSKLCEERRRNKKCLGDIPRQRRENWTARDVKARENPSFLAADVYYMH